MQLKNLRRSFWVLLILLLLSCSGAALQEGTDYQFSDKPAAGHLAGRDFTVENATVSDLGVLILRQGQDLIAEKELTITFPLTQNEKISGKVLKVGKGSALSGMLAFIVPRPTVTMKWQGDSGLQRRAFVDGFVLVIEFGQGDEAHIPGKIYFKTSWEHEDYVIGTFDAVVR